jgi:hypothetical protein
MKVASALALIISLVGDNGALGQTEECNICGEGFNVTNPDGIIVDYPTQGNITCAQLDEFSDNFGVDICSGLLQFTQEPCGCTMANVTMPSGNETVAPTDAPGNVTLAPSDAPGNETSAPSDAPGNATDAPAAPTESPTFGPAPDCFDDIDNALARERAVTDTSVQRTIILCPNKDYFMGRADPDRPGFVIGGFNAISPRPNSHWKCGEEGLASNNCIMKDGDFPIVSFGGDVDHTNIIFSGITVEASFRGGMLLANSGDVTFSSCVFRVSVCDGGVTHFLFERLSKPTNRAVLLSSSMKILELPWFSSIALLFVV